MNKVRISILGFVFLVFFLLPEPNFIFTNFWSRAEFWDLLPFVPNYLLFKFLYATIMTGFIEVGIRFIKKYA
jgi:hypothetical protein